MSIVLRPHHLLCTQGYSGKGYDNDFVAHMTDVVHQLRDVPGTTIRHKPNLFAQIPNGLCMFLKMVRNPSKHLL